MMNRFARSMPLLERVSITGCGITSLNFLRHAKGLLELDVRDNAISDPDEIMLLKKLPLRKLRLEGNPVTESDRFTAMCQRAFDDVEIDAYPQFGADRELLARICKTEAEPTLVESDHLTDFPVHLCFLNWKGGAKKAEFRNVRFDAEQFYQ